MSRSDIFSQMDPTPTASDAVPCLIEVFSSLKYISSFQPPKDPAEELRLVQAFQYMRHISAIEIQRLWRGYSERVLIRSPRGNILIKWRLSTSDSTSVYVAGEFNDWKKWKMKYCGAYKDYRISVPTGLVRGRNSFEYKFIVDGLWTCDGSLPMVESTVGTVNNIYMLKRADQRLASSLYSGKSNMQQKKTSLEAESLKEQDNSPVPHLSNRLPPPTIGRRIH
jgi:hypothetical protein